MGVTTVSIQTLGIAKKYNTNHNDTQHKDTQQNDIQHNDIQHNIQCLASLCRVQSF